MEESLISNRDRLRHTDLGRRICSVWELPNAETITCVVPNVFARWKYYPVRAEHAFPPTQDVYTPRQKTLPVGSHSSFRLKPSRSSGAPSAPGAFGAGRASRGTALRAVGLASLG